MKGRKYKRFHHYVRTIYELGFDMHAPYHVLVDAEMCCEALKHKLDLRESVPMVLGGSVRLMTTACVVDRLKKMESEKTAPTGASFVAKRLELRRCKCKTALAKECLLELIKPNNPFHYVLAAQQADIRQEARKIPGVPLLFVRQGLVLLEEPTIESKQYALEKERTKLKPKEFDIEQLEKTVPLQREAAKISHRRKKAKGPNPLSCKPKKKPLYIQGDEPKKRKRRRKVSKPCL